MTAATALMGWESKHGTRAVRGGDGWPLPFFHYSTQLCIERTRFEIPFVHRVGKDRYYPLHHWRLGVFFWTSAAGVRPASYVYILLLR